MTIIDARARIRRMRLDCQNSFTSATVRTWGKPIGTIERGGISFRALCGDATHQRELAGRLINCRALGAKPSNQHARQVIGEMRSFRAIMEET